jgi:precorrin-4 methylase
MSIAAMPETVQTAELVEAKVTGNPELAVAESVKGVPTVCAPGLAKLIVCASTLTVKLCETGTAAAYVVLPGCVAWRVQVPSDRNVVALLETVQTLGVVEAKLTSKPELAVADSAIGIPTVCPPGLAKLIVCASSLTVKLCETELAAA